MRLKLLFLGGCVLCLALTLAGGSTAFADNILVQSNVVVLSKVVLSDPRVSTPEPSSLALMGIGLIGFSVLAMLLRSKKSEDATS